MKFLSREQRILGVLFFTLLIDMIGVGMLIPIIPSLFTDSTSSSFLLDGFSVSEQFLVAGLITAVFSFMQFLTAPILGELSDMFGRKKLLTLGVAMLALSQLLFAIGIAAVGLEVEVVHDDLADAFFIEADIADGRVFHAVTGLVDAPLYILGHSRKSLNISIFNLVTTLLLFLMNPCVETTKVCSLSVLSQKASSRY